MRKKITFYVALVCLLSAFQCEEDDYDPDYSIENNDLIEIEGNKSTFLVDDYIIINTEIANQQTTVDAKTLALKDFIVGNEISLFHSLSLYKLSADNGEIPYPIESIEEFEGSTSFSDGDSFISMNSFYDETDDSFKNSVGIKLFESGNYLIKPSTSRNNLYQIIFDLRGLTSVGDLQLTTSISKSDDDGIYRFTVE